MLFSHPKDFTPVCTTELGYMASIQPEFEKRDVKVIGLSADPVEDHARWAADIEETQGSAPNYPLIGDADFNVSKLFGMLPAPQGAEFRALWDEFEGGETPTARFANALDRLQPMMQNDANGGGTWREHRVTRAAVLDRAGPVVAGLPALWDALRRTIDAHCAAGAILGDDPSRA